MSTIDELLSQTEKTENFIRLFMTSLVNGTRLSNNIPSCI